MNKETNLFFFRDASHDLPTAAGIGPTPHVAIEPLRRCDQAGIRGLDGDQLWGGAIGSRLRTGRDFFKSARLRGMKPES